MPQGNQGSNPCPSGGRHRYHSLGLLVLLGLIFAGAGPLPAAEPLREDPFVVAKRQFEEHQLDEALATIAAVEKKEQPGTRLLLLRGQILLEQGKYEAALEQLRKVHETDKATYAQLYVGDAFLRQKQWAEARDAYRVAIKETDILNYNERLRYAIFLTYLGEKNEAEAQNAYNQIPFPTQSAAFYYAQAAWAFAHGRGGEAQKWLHRAEEIYPDRSSAWFARKLYDLGWIKTRPPLVAD